jgi:hypothetical protein
MRSRDDVPQRFPQHGAAGRLRRVGYAGRILFVLSGVALLSVVAILASFWWSSSDESDSADPSDASDRNTGLTTSAPLLPSDQEALATATAAYTEYQAMIDKSFMAMDDVGLDAVAEGTALEIARSSIDNYSQRGLRQSGLTSVDSTRLVSPPTQGVGGEIEIQIYACLDVTDVDVLDSEGQSRLGPSPDLRFPFIATVVVRSAEGSPLVAADDFWEGDNFCG